MAVFIEDCGDRESLSDLAARLVQAIESEPVLAGGASPVTVDAWVGIADTAGPGSKASELLLCAKAAAHTAAAGGEKWMFFCPAIVDEARNRADLTNELRHALGAKQFELVYQPQVDASDGRIVAVEALIRWRHPRRGLVMPDVFIHVAESCGLIDAIGRWVIDEACHQAGQWRRQGLRMRLAINLSVVQLRRPDLVDCVLGALARNGVPPECLTCEITESVAMGSAQAARSSIARLTAAGVCMSIDDFGTGYSSLKYLSRLPVSELKIDRSFVRSICDDPKVRAVLGAVFRMASELGLNVVAEGVESVEQRDMLLSLGARQFQGYLYGKPMKAKALGEWAENDRRKQEAFSDSVFRPTDVPGMFVV